MNFETFNLNPRVFAGVKALGYTEPTPIQDQTIPLILQGRDVMGLAQTGTGKTAAFGLPILHRLVDGPRGFVRALIVAPTRELAEQINDAITEMGQQTRVRSTTIYGGVNMNPQVQKLRGGVEIVVACPGRLLDHMGQGTIDLSRVEVLVLDEADRMFDMGFLPDIRKIVKRLPTKRQTLLFSATMPDDIRQLAREVLHDATTVQIGHSAPVHTVAHALYPVEQHLKTPLLIELLKSTRMDSVLIFTRTKHRAKRVAQQLAKAGYEATSLQGNLSQNRRQAAMDGFRDGSYQILVATDIAARGIDVEQISHVINYDIPDTVDAYTHRIGRTGRAERSGDAYTLVTREDNDMIRAIETVLKYKLERRMVEGFDYKAPRPARDVEFARPPREPRRRQPTESYGAARPRHDDRPKASVPAPQRRVEQPADFEFGNAPAPKPAPRPSSRPAARPARNGSSTPQRQGDSQDTRKPQRVFPNNPNYKPYR